jgi:PIN domain nuclease of toxin-antitoxin system
MLDTHICVWHVMGDKRLSRSHGALLRENEISGLGVSVISCWEVANLVRLRRLQLPLPVVRVD